MTGAVSLGGAAAEWSGAERMALGGWTVRFRAAGRGPALVLVHGLGVSADYWVRNGPPLAAAGFRVLAPDLPGFGGSEGPAEGLPVERQARVVARWADAVGLGPAVYVGHSLSCQGLLQLAADEPGRVRGLVLAAPTGDRGAHRPLREAWGLLRDVPREPPALVPYVLAAYVRAGPRRLLHTWLRSRPHDLLPLLPRVRCPALVVAGGRDPVVPLRFTTALAEGLPCGRHVVVENGAHALHFRPAERFNALVRAFATEVEDEGSCRRRDPDG